jgi:hypothetical protein
MMRGGFNPADPRTQQMAAGYQHRLDSGQNLMTRGPESLAHQQVYGGTPAGKPGQAQSQQSPYATSTPYGAYNPNIANNPQAPRPPAFQASYGQPDGSFSSQPNFGQRDAFIQNLNQQAGMQTGGMPQFNFGQAWNQAGNMVQQGWQNPFAPQSPFAGQMAVPGGMADPGQKIRDLLPPDASIARPSNRPPPTAGQFREGQQGGSDATPSGSFAALPNVDPRQYMTDAQRQADDRTSALLQDPRFLNWIGTAEPDWFFWAGDSFDKYHTGVAQAHERYLAETGQGARPPGRPTAPGQAQPAQDPYGSSTPYAPGFRYGYRPPPTAEQFRKGQQEQKQKQFMNDLYSRANVQAGASQDELMLGLINSSRGGAAVSRENIANLPESMRDAMSLYSDLAVNLQGSGNNPLRQEYAGALQQFKDRLSERTQAARSLQGEYGMSPEDAAAWVDREMPLPTSEQVYGGLRQRSDEAKAKERQASLDRRAKQEMEAAKPKAPSATEQWNQIRMTTNTQTKPLSPAHQRVYEAMVAEQMKSRGMGDTWAAAGSPLANMARARNAKTGQGITGMEPRKR